MDEKDLDKRPRLAQEAQTLEAPTPWESIDPQDVESRRQLTAPEAAELPPARLIEPVHATLPTQPSPFANEVISVPGEDMKSLAEEIRELAARSPAKVAQAEVLAIPAESTDDRLAAQAFAPMDESAAQAQAVDDNTPVAEAIAADPLSTATDVAIAEAPDQPIAETAFADGEQITLLDAMLDVSDKIDSLTPEQLGKDNLGSMLPEVVDSAQSTEAESQPKFDVAAVAIAEPMPQVLIQAEKKSFFAEMSYEKGAWAALTSIEVSTTVAQPTSAEAATTAFALTLSTEYQPVESAARSTDTDESAFDEELVVVSEADSKLPTDATTAAPSAEDLMPGAQLELQFPLNPSAEDAEAEPELEVMPAPVVVPILVKPVEVVATGSVWTIPVLCLGIGLIACCMAIPQIEANRKLRFEQAALTASLAAVRQQADVNDRFLRRVMDDPELSERLARRQLKMAPKGHKAVALASLPGDNDMSPFALTTISPPPAVPAYRPIHSTIAYLCNDAKSRLVLLAIALMCVAIGLIMEPASQDEAVD